MHRRRRDHQNGDTITRTITVLRDARDVQAVTTRYREKGWDVVHLSETDDAHSVHLHLERERPTA